MDRNQILDSNARSVQEKAIYRIELDKHLNHNGARRAVSSDVSQTSIGDDSKTWTAVVAAKHF